MPPSSYQSTLRISLSASFYPNATPIIPENATTACFGSITLNKHELHFSQAKLELYGLYHALSALRFYLIGVRNLIVEVDARYIKGMLMNPDVAPSASINRWIVLILTFHFTLVHVAGTHHGPDGLSRCPLQDEDSVIDDEEDLETGLTNSMDLCIKSTPF
jgi:hypothetical protein